MKQWMLILALTLTTSQVFASAQDVLNESLYYQYQKSILQPQKSLNKSFQVFSQYEQTIFINALEDLIEEGNPTALETLEQIDPFYYELSEQLRVYLLKLKARKIRTLPKEFSGQVANALKQREVDLKIIYLLAAYEDHLERAGNRNLLEEAKKFPEYFELNKERRITTASSLRDLFYRAPDLSSILNKKYQGGVKLYLFCRTNRLYPCMMLLKDAKDEPIRNADGSLWTHKALASSKFGLPSYTRNGNTPTGVMTIDSVMPVADQQTSFGKFRRMILNFIPFSQGETTLLSVLPESAKNDEWWKPGTVARDIGRSDLRIHGSGKRNEDPNSTFWPFLQTSGCIAQRENTYGEITFADQRVLLDEIMTAMELEPTYANETKIKGLLYINEIDSDEAAVELSDLNAIGIQ